MARLKNVQRAIGVAWYTRNGRIQNFCRKCCDVTVVSTLDPEAVRSGLRIRYIYQSTEDCASCHKPLAPPKRERKPRSGGWYVNEYVTHNEYGGPEEGGWWYDRRYIRRSTRYPSERIARRMAHRVWLAQLAGKVRDGWSVQLEREPGKTDSRMRYE